MTTVLPPPVRYRRDSVVRDPFTDSVGGPRRTRHTYRCVWRRWDPAPDAVGVTGRPFRWLSRGGHACGAAERRAAEADEGTRGYALLRIPQRGTGVQGGRHPSPPLLGGRDVPLLRRPRHGQDAGRDVHRR